MSITKKARFAIFTRDKFTCRYCGRNSEITTLEVDHVIPRAGGGTDDQANLVTSCFDCNRGKSDSLIESAPTVDFLAMAQEMREQQEVARIMQEQAMREIEARREFSIGVSELLGLRDPDEFEPTTMNVLQSFAREFGVPVVLGWVEKAFNEVGYRGHSAVGRYVSGIRRSIKEGNR